MTFNYEQSQVEKLGYASNQGYTVVIENRENGRQTKHLLANASQVARIGGILAEGSEDAETPARDVHIRHAQMFADMLYALNARDGDGSSDAIGAYASERSDENGHPVTAYAHVRAAMRWAVAQIAPDLADEVMEAFSDCGESVRYCLERVEREHAKANKHRMTLEVAEQQRGCWVEGSRGWTAPGVMINKAADWGFPLDDNDRALVDHYLAGEATHLTLPDGEHVDADDLRECVAGRGELSDRATDWLNEHVAPEGWTFGWSGGEFFLLPESEWDENGDVVS